MSFIWLMEHSRHGVDQGRTEPGAGWGVVAGWGGRGRPLPGRKPLEPSGPLAMRTPFGAPGAWP